ncbi:MAG: thiamine-phosphate kinase, partial [Stenotrophobium sp.]
MDEFALIRSYFSGLTAASEGVTLGIGDDCALLQVPAGHELAVTTDTLVCGRHFPETAAPFDIGWKSLAVNLSDLAAMGAQARWFALALTLPRFDATWLENFATGLKALAYQSVVSLVGGDTTRWPLSITISALGTVPRGQALKRAGAKAGDAICVTGTLGDAALA